jgi:hypothetical protein
MNKFENKVLCFATSLNNTYKEDEDREDLPKLELTEEGLTEDFTAMLQAMRVNYIRITDDDVDLIGFTHLLNRLAIQHVMEQKD